MATGTSRRHFLQSMAMSGGVVGLSQLSLGRACAQEAQIVESRQKLLDDVVRSATKYFWEMADPETGMVLDRASYAQDYTPGISSIAATGFGLSSLCIGHVRGYLDREAAEKRVKTTLSFLVNQAEQQHGFFYHFLDSATGKRKWGSELSSIDTSWLLCGVLHSRTYWKNPEIQQLCSTLLSQVDWRWMLNGGKTLSHGWTPEQGFLPYRWDTYAELLAMYLLAIGSDGNGIPPECWDAWKRPMLDYNGLFYIDDSTPIFVHQYSHAWFDFRNRKDRYADYFFNSQRATQAHRRYCIELSKKFPWYGPDMWGVTASESRGGYRVWGSPASPPDGTLVPCAAGGSIVFMPNSCLTVLEKMREIYGDKVWCKYGYIDAFHPQAEWYSHYVLGIDLGIMMMMAENARTDDVWDAVMGTPEAVRSFDAVELRIKKA